MCDEQKSQNETLASCPGLGSITVCPCGTVSLHVGGVSVRMELSAYMQVAKMCHVAMLSLDSQFRNMNTGVTSASTVTH